MSNYNLMLGDCLIEMKKLPDNSVDSIVTDPPYGLSFMGKKWDYDVPSVEIWREALRVLKPGGHLLAFGGTRTYHRLAVNIEDAGFEIRDQIQWLYGSGFPKSMDVSKQIDKQAFDTWLNADENRTSKNLLTELQHSGDKNRYDTTLASLKEVAGMERKIVGSKLGQPGYHLVPNAGNGMLGAGVSSNTYKTKLAASQITAPSTDAAKQWQGWGTALKPANEPICMARKPLEAKLTVAQNVQKYGTGALNIDASRIATNDNLNGGRYSDNKQGDDGNSYGKGINLRSASDYSQPEGRWPANVILNEEAGQALDAQSGISVRKDLRTECKSQGMGAGLYEGGKIQSASRVQDQGGGASRFFYCAKSSKRERGEGNVHPTVKPISLMSYLIKLVTPPGGTVLDPFMGSGTTGLAAIACGNTFIGIEMSEEYMAIATARIEAIKTDEVA